MAFVRQETHRLRAELMTCNEIINTHEQTIAMSRQVIEMLEAESEKAAALAQQLLKALEEENDRLLKMCSP